MLFEISWLCFLHPLYLYVFILLSLFSLSYLVWFCTQQLFLSMWSPVLEGSPIGPCWEVVGTKLHQSLQTLLIALLPIGFSKTASGFNCYFQIGLLYFFMSASWLFWFFCTQGHRMPCACSYWRLPPERISQLSITCRSYDLRVCGHSFLLSLVVNVVHGLQILLSVCSVFIWDFEKSKTMYASITTAVPPEALYGKCICSQQSLGRHSISLFCIGGKWVIKDGEWFIPKWQSWDLNPWNPTTFYYMTVSLTITIPILYHL